METEEVYTLMGILAVYCGFAKKGLLKGSAGGLPSEQQRAIDEFARVNGCEIFWSEGHGLYLWGVLDSE